MVIYEEKAEEFGVVEADAVSFLLASRSAFAIQLAWRARITPMNVSSTDSTTRRPPLSQQHA